MKEQITFSSKSNGTGIDVSWNPQSGMFQFDVSTYSNPGIHSCSCYLYPAGAAELGRFLLLVESAKQELDFDNDDIKAMQKDVITFSNSVKALEKLLQANLEVVKKDLAKELQRLREDIDASAYRLRSDILAIKKKGK